VCARLSATSGMRLAGATAVQHRYATSLTRNRPKFKGTCYRTDMPQCAHKSAMGLGRITRVYVHVCAVRCERKHTLGFPICSRVQEVFVAHSLVVASAKRKGRSSMPGMLQTALDVLTED